MSSTHETIDAVIERMEKIIDECIRTGDKLGYFATLYRDVTVRVRDGIVAGRFEDGPRMERMDVIFAGRYLTAYDQYRRGEKPSLCWEIAFSAAKRRSPVILQHLLLGMNAHINLDLAIAAARTSPGADVGKLQRDFMEITDLLDEMIDEIQDRIDQVSPWLGLLDKIGGRTDERIMAFAIKEARDIAWKAAERLAVAEADIFDRETLTHDQIVAALGRMIRFPGPFTRLALMLVRMRERSSVAEVIQALRI